MARSLRLLVAALALAVAVMHAGLGPGQGSADHAGGHGSMTAAAVAGAGGHSVTSPGGHDPAPMPGAPCAFNEQVCVSTPVLTTPVGVDLLAVAVLGVALVLALWRPTTPLGVPRRRWRSPPALSALCVWRI